MNDPADQLDCYLVGGAVRDRLLGLDVKDRDWVVIGSTPETMVELGFKSVGNDFPVFLHPRSHEEYALARTERKSGRGYKGFTVYAQPDVSLEQDLARRDLTINAIAQSPDGDIVDPFNGRADLKTKTLRHVSSAFVEDPVRVLRVARFAARFAGLEFSVAPETNELMCQMVTDGELDFLAAERVWQEVFSALKTSRPSCFISTLRDCAALKAVLPEIDALFGVPQPETHHPEIDTGVHTLMALDVCTQITNDPIIRFAVLLHDLGKALTPKHELPRHIAHEHHGLKPLQALCDRLRVPNKYRQFAARVCQHHLKMHQLMQLKASTVIDLLQSLDAFRNPDKVNAFAIACEADARGRMGLQDKPYPQRELLNQFFTAAQEVNAAKIATASSDAKDIAQSIRQARIAAVRHTAEALFR